MGLVVLAAALATPPAPPAPAPTTGLRAGDLLVFAGTVVEEVRRPGKDFRRAHDLELTVLVLDGTDRWADAAVLTCLRRTADAVAGSAGAVTGRAPRADTPPLVRLDLVRRHSDGTTHLLAPEAGPLRLDARTPARALPSVPVDAYAASEFGAFPPKPPRDEDDGPWTVAAGPARPAETWQARGFKFLNGERCRYLVMNQQSADWARPAGGTAWHRAEAVWVSTQDGTARKVHRVILQRDGRVESPPAAWVEVKYELTSQTTLTGRTFDRARRDVEAAHAALADAALPLAPRAFEARLARLDAHAKESDPAGPFREGLAAARRALAAARDGDPVRPAVVPTSASASAPARSSWPEPGDRAPEARAGDFRVADRAGKPAVVVFLKPNGETTPLTLAVSDALAKRYAGKVDVAPFVVFGDAAAAAGERDRLGFSVPLHDGAAAGAAWGVETVPRFALVDADGRVRWTFTGVGAETGYLLREEADRLLAPASPARPGGTIAPPGPLGVPIVPPP